MTTKPLIFRLYPVQEWPTRKRSSLYVRVLIWPTRSAMLDHLRRSGGETKNVHGYCSADLVYRVKGNRVRLKPVVAEVSLYRDAITPPVIAHELLHATFAWARRMDLDFTGVSTGETMADEEERLCYVHDSLIDQFSARYTRALKAA